MRCIRLKETPPSPRRKKKEKEKKKDAAKFVVIAIVRYRRRESSITALSETRDWRRRATLREEAGRINKKGIWGAGIRHEDLNEEKGLKEEDEDEQPWAADASLIRGRRPLVTVCPEHGPPAQPGSRDAVREPSERILALSRTSPDGLMDWGDKRRQDNPVFAHHTRSRMRRNPLSLLLSLLMLL